MIFPAGKTGPLAAWLACLPACPPARQPGDFQSVPTLSLILNRSPQVQPIAALPIRLRKTVPATPRLKLMTSRTSLTSFSTSTCSVALQTPIDSARSSNKMASTLRSTLLRQTAAATRSMAPSARAGPSLLSKSQITAFHASSRRNLLPPGPRTYPYCLSNAKSNNACDLCYPC